jgi:two-component system, NtrC family, sensor kinase
MMGDMLGRSIRPNDSDALGARAGSEEFNGGDMAAKFDRLVGPAAAARETAAPALHALKCAQARLLRAQKMAALGQFTAGVAHEIRNPLNFVNNFAELSVALLGELRRAVVPAIIGLDGEKRAEIDEIIETLTMNLEKIAEHGRRAGGIVNNMLLQSHGGRGDWREVDLNALLDQTLSLACHSARAQNQRFDTTVERDFDAGLRTIEIVPQDISRVFLNLIGNGLYAAHQRARAAGESFQPALKVTTRDLGDVVEIRAASASRQDTASACSSLSSRRSRPTKGQGLAFRSAMTS